MHCLTKSELILRDLDLLKEIDEKAVLPSDLRSEVNRGVLITLSLSTLDEKIAKVFEPGAPKPMKRLETLQRVKEAGFHTGIAYIPVLPFISDSNEQLEEMVKTAREFDADYIFVGALTLYGEGKKPYFKVLEKHFSELSSEYKKLFKAYNQPSKNYQRRLEVKAKRLCEMYGVRCGIT